MSRRTLINLIFFNVVFLLMLFWAINNIITVDQVERPYTITGDFAQAAGVKSNAEVTYLGVHYGRVTSVERTPGGVSVKMKIDRDKDIPAGAIARIFRKSAIGEPYIDFVPPESYEKGSTDRIEPGDNVPISRTTVPLEFSELLRSASALVSSIDPEATGSLIHELAVGLNGRGESLRSLTESIDQLTASFVERTDQLDRLADNSTRVTSTLADHRLSLGRAITNLRTLAETLRAADGDTRVLLDLGPDFLGTTADLVADQKQNLDCLLTDLAPVLRTLNGPDQLEDLAVTPAAGPARLRVRGQHRRPRRRRAVGARQPAGGTRGHRTPTCTCRSAPCRSFPRFPPARPPSSPGARPPRDDRPRAHHRAHVDVRRRRSACVRPGCVLAVGSLDRNRCPVLLLLIDPGRRR